MSLNDRKEPDWMLVAFTAGLALGAGIVLIAYMLNTN
ncbi:hypothetical protein UFOVP111_65 [uncultured Caudovirales phage]|uniref:Uncharacterized protein n=1 Tax=uncultured Caudovirales phage TaxID=2100421 RepID=A0A6J5L5R0_9CAUD|nr:hypothetical protein UFOVP111_65 [uncultured Caudovirales phage]